MHISPLIIVTCMALQSSAQVTRGIGKFQEVFAWRQLVYNIDGVLLTEDRQSAAGLGLATPGRVRRQSGTLVFDNESDRDERDWDSRPTSTTESNPRRTSSTTESNRWRTTTQRTASNESGAFFIQYNNIPMGAERVGNRLFVAVPRRRYGVPSTLNYLDLNEDSSTRSPGLRPYPSIRQASELTSVYRTRADDCGRLWMVDTGVLEIPNNRQQVRPPAIVIYDLRTDRQILRYPFQSSDLVSELTPTGLASITVDVTNTTCDSAYAYVPDLATYGLIVFSLRDRSSWRLTHNYFNFDPAVGNLIISGQRFQWNDGVFSVTLTEPGMGGCRTAYFHPMVSTREFSVSTCVLQNRTAASDPNFWAQFTIVGDRGADSHSTMHGYHAGSGAVIFASMARDGVACWHTSAPLNSAAVQLLARDSGAMAYPADLHITGDEVWVLTNSLPTWIYSRLDTNEYNFHIYRANVFDLIANTVCTGRPVSTFTNRNGLPEDEQESTNEGETNPRE